VSVGLIVQALAENRFRNHRRLSSDREEAALMRLILEQFLFRVDCRQYREVQAPHESNN
jgi:hypothetical protein